MPARIALRCRVSGREKPDLWVADPFKSLVLQLLADMRLIASNDYATEQSVRFPRVDCVRWGSWGLYWWWWWVGGWVWAGVVVVVGVYVCVCGGGVGGGGTA